MNFQKIFLFPADNDGNLYYSSDRVKAILDNGILLDDYNNSGGGEITLDLTFLNADKGSFQLWIWFINALKLLFQLNFMMHHTLKSMKVLIYTYDAEGEDPRLTNQNIETDYLVDGSKGEITTIMNSNGYYD